MSAASGGRRLVLGFNLLCVHARMAGIRSYAVNLFGEIIRQNREFEIVLFVPSGAPWLVAALARAAGRDALPDGVAVEVMRCDPARKLAMFCVENLRLPAALRRRRVDLLISPDYHGPLLAGRPQVVTIHDMRFKDLPETFSRPQRWLREALSPLIIRRAAALWTISPFATARLAACYPTSAGKARLIGSGGPQGSATRPAAEPGDYLLSVGTFVPHKNHLSLVRAVLELPEPTRLVIVGEPGPALQDEGLRDALGRAGRRVEVRHGIGDDELQGLYRRARGYVTASLYEGFGLTVLEAMSHGVPVACSNIRALSAVVGDAALTFDPHDPHQVAAALRRLASDQPLRASLVQRGFARLPRHTWGAAAARALAACAEHLALQPSSRVAPCRAEPAE